MIITTSKKKFPKAEDKIRINENISSPQVRLIDADGKQVGVLSIEEALTVADEEGLDLIEVSPNASPPVCRLMDYGKYKYQLNKRQHEARRHQKTIQVKEIKLRPKTEEHDFHFKLKNAIRFLSDGNKVKITIMFRGREVTHRDLGVVLLKKFQEAVGDYGIIEQPLKDEGRFITIVLAPSKAKSQK